MERLDLSWIAPAPAGNGDQEPNSILGSLLPTLRIHLPRAESPELDTEKHFYPRFSVLCSGFMALLALFLIHVRVTGGREGLRSCSGGFAVEK